MTRRVSGLLSTPDYWRDLAKTLHWESATREISPAYAAWMSEKSNNHSYTEVILCVAGDHPYGIGGEAIAFSPGSAAIILPGQMHDSWYSEHHEACIDLWLHFYTKGRVHLNFTDHTPGHDLKSVTFTLTGSSHQSDFERAADWLNQATEPSPKLEAFTAYFLQMVLEKLALGEIAEPVVDEHKVVAEMKEYISRNLAERLNLEELSRVAGYSPFYFHRIFTQAEGITPRHFIEVERIRYACRLLESGHSVTAAALDSGFSNSSLFGRAFKKHLKVAPGQWVRKREL